MKINETSREIWRRRLSARRGDAAAVLVVVIFCALFFGGAIFRGKFLIGGDAFFQAYPLRAAAWEMIRNGGLPLWTPLVFSGYPMLAMPQLGLAYPLTWGHLILPARHAEMIYILAPFIFAPAFTYAYLREVGRSRLSALFGGLSFGYGGLMTNTYGMNAVPTNALMWLPLLLVVVERARTRTLARSIAHAALVYAMSILTGHGQSFLFVGMLAIAYALFLVFVARAGEARESVRRSWCDHLIELRRWRPLAACACGMLLATGVGAFQILETMRAARRSIRSSLSYEFFVEASFTPQAAWRSFIAPLYYFIEVTPYISPLACALAVCAVALALRGRRKMRGALDDDGTTFDARVLFWAAVALISVPLMLGESTPLYRVLYHVPVFNLFRRPSRHVFEWTFALSVLAAYGWDALSRAYAERAKAVREKDGTGWKLEWKLVAGTIALVVAAALGALWWRASHGLPYVGDAVPRAEAAYLVWKIFFTVALAVAAYFVLSARGRSGRRRELLSACVLLLACFVEPHILVSHWWPGTAKTAARLTTPSRSTRYLQQFPAHENRVYVRANSATEEYASAPRFDAHDLTALYGLHNVAGYEGLLLERYSRALGGLDYDAVNPRRGVRPSLALFAPESHVLDLLNATRVVTFANLATTPAPAADEPVMPARDALDPARWQVEEEFDGIVILRNRRALPRAWLVAAAEAVDGETALRRIRGEDEKQFDPRRTALLEVAPSELPALAGGELSAESEARVVEYQANRLVVETRASREAVLVVSEMNYPGWEARVDGERVRVHATNYLLRGVFVPAGVHRVEMRYTAPAARNGAFISVLSLSIIGGLLVYARAGESAVRQN